MNEKGSTREKKCRCKSLGRGVVELTRAVATRYTVNWSGSTAAWSASESEGEPMGRSPYSPVTVQWDAVIFFINTTHGRGCIRGGWRE